MGEMDLLLVLTEHPPGIHPDEDDEPVMVAAYKGKNYMMLWYLSREVGEDFHPDEGDILLEGVYAKAHTWLEGDVANVKVEFVESEVRDE